MEDGKVHGGCLERLGHSHLCRHGHALNGFLDSRISSHLSLSGSHCLRHTLGYHLFEHLLIHPWIHRPAHSALHGIGNGTTYGACDSIAEVDRGIRIEPLVGAEESARMLPTALAMTAENKLLSNGVHLLTLLEHQVVGRHIVLVHQHLIFQELIAGGGGKEQIIHIVTDAQTCIQHVALISVHDGSGGILHRLVSWEESRT